MAYTEKTSSCSLFIFRLLARLCQRDGLGLLPCRWGGKKGKFVRELLEGVEAFRFLIYRKNYHFFSCLPRQKFFKTFL